MESRAFVLQPRRLLPAAEDGARRPGVASPGARLWRQPDFVKLWSAFTISELGNQVTFLALPLVAIVVLGASPFQVALLTTFRMLPFLLVGLPAGVWVDRLPRRQILLVGDLGRGICLVSVPVAFAIGVLTMAQLYLVAFITGLLAVFFDVASQASLPMLVQTTDLLDANSRLEVSRSGMQLSGPGLAGGLVRLVSAPVAIVADSISFLGSSLFLRRIQPLAPASEEAGAGHPPMRVQIKKGLRYVFANPILRPIAVTTAAFNLFLAMSGSLYVLFAVRQLHLSPGLIGLVMALGNVGFVVGALSASRIPRRLGIGPTICMSASSFGVPLIAVVLAPTGTRAIPVLVAGGLVASFGTVVYGTNQVSMRQAITSPEMLGRMTATMKFVIVGVMPIGSFIGGALAASLGLRPTMWIAAVAGSLAFLPLVVSPVRTLREIPGRAFDGRADQALTPITIEAT